MDFSEPELQAIFAARAAADAAEASRKAAKEKRISKARTTDEPVDGADDQVEEEVLKQLAGKRRRDVAEEKRRMLAPNVYEVLMDGKPPQELNKVQLHSALLYVWPTFLPSGGGQAKKSTLVAAVQQGIDEQPDGCAKWQARHDAAAAAGEEGEEEEEEG